MGIHGLRAGECAGDLATRFSQFVPEISPSPHFTPGALINERYRIEASLGEGGMGLVYRVTDLLRPKQPTALKIIRGLVGGEYAEIRLSNLNLFKAEFKTMAELRHPQLASVYDFDAVGETEDYFFTMELVASASSILEVTEGADWRKVLEFVVPLCRVLSYVHSRGIIHFDIKPANVLVDKDGNVKVVDFGISGLKTLSTANLIAGSVNYMAPEVGVSGAVIDHRADLYSLGILIYQLLTRSLPFKASTFSKILEQHQKLPLTWDETASLNLPQWLRAIVERLCAKNPADRFKTANRVIDAINREGGFSFELETQKTRESYIFSSRFVGRDREFGDVIQFIQERMSHKSTGNPVLFVSGPSGIGKSRLFHEVRCHSQLSRMPFVEGNCYEGNFDEYGAIGELIAFLLPVLETGGHRQVIDQFGPELAKILPSLGQRYDIKPSSSLGNPEAEGLRLREQVSEFFVRVAEIMPYTMYINDLQWAPTGTCDLLYYLAWRIILRERLGDPCPMTLLGSFRVDEVESRPLERILTRLRDEGVLQVLELSPLPSENISPLLESMLGVGSLPSAFVDRVVRETDGNPFFIEEVMRSLVENGSVYIENGMWAAATQIEKLDFPEKISDVFLRRANLLSPKQRLIVDQLAVGARPTPLPVLAKAVSLPELEVGSALAALERKQMVQRDGKYFHLSHDRMREALYWAISDPDRREFHLHLGEAIERHFGPDLSTQWVSLAYHFAKAGEKAKTIHYSVLAGNDVRERHATETAINMYEQALPLLDSSDPRCFEIRENLADSYRMSGRYQEAAALLDRLLAETSETPRKARLHTQMGRLLFERGAINRALDQMWQAVELRGEWRPQSRAGKVAGLVGAFVVQLFHRYFPRWIRKASTAEEKDALREQCITYAKIAETSWFCDPLDTILTLFRATNYGERIGESNDLCRMYGGFLAVFSHLAMFRFVEPYQEIATKMAQRLNSPWLLGQIMQNRSALDLCKGSWEKAFEHAMQGISLLRAGGDYFEITWSYFIAVQASIYLAEFERAKFLSEEAIELCQRTQVKGYCYLSAQHAIAVANLGQTEAAVSEAEMACQQAEQDSGDAFSLCFSEMALGECLLASGDTQGGIHYLEKARALREAKKLFQDWLIGIYPLLARGYFEEWRKNGTAPSPKKIREVEKIVRRAARLSKRHPNFLVPSLLARSRLAATQGKVRASRRHLYRALRVAEQQKAGLYLQEIRSEEALHVR